MSNKKQFVYIKKHTYFRGCFIYFWFCVVLCIPILNFFVMKKVAIDFKTSDYDADIYFCDEIWYDIEKIQVQNE